jgi:Mg-chelatase subunit ChlD
MAAANPIIYKAFQISETLVATQIKAQAVEQQRQPVHLIALIDTSGSMESDNKLKNVNTSLTFLLEHMTANDYLSLITFSTDAHMHFSQKKMTADGKTEVEHIMGSLKSDGSTNMSAAILQANEVLLNNPAVKECVIFLTDGQANVGVTDATALIGLLEATMATHSTLSYTTIGYGTDHNTELLRVLATEGGGSYNVVNSLENTAVVFGDILGGLLTCIAQNVKITYPVDTKIYTGYAVHGNKVHIGDVQSEADIYILSDKLPVEVKGYMLPGGIAFNSPIPVCEATDDDKKAIKIAHLRYKVSELMKQLSTVDIYRLTDDQKAEVNARIDAIRAEIDGEPESAIWSLLKKQLTDCKNMLEAPRLYMGTAALLSQQSACIATGRGIMSGDHDPIASPFANGMQRNISTGMRSVVQRSNGSSGLRRQDANHIDPIATQSDL